MLSIQRCLELLGGAGKYTDEQIRHDHSVPHREAELAANVDRRRRLQEAPLSKGISFDGENLGPPQSKVVFPARGVDTDGHHNAVPADLHANGPPPVPIIGETIFRVRLV